MVDGLPAILVEDELKALGNALVWQQVYPILQGIADYELSASAVAS